MSDTLDFLQFRQNDNPDKVIQFNPFRSVKVAVYFARQRGTNFVKIGFSKLDAGSRVAALQIGSPMLLEILGVMPGEQKLESSLHRHFAAQRVRGEWFRMSPDLAELIARSNPEFAHYAAIEPQLLLIARMAGEIDYEDGEPFCAMAAWHGYGGFGIKQQVEFVVGWLRKDKSIPELCTTKAYDAVYDTISKILPDCRDCNCLSLDFASYD